MIALGISIFALGLAVLALFEVYHLRRSSGERLANLEREDRRRVEMHGLMAVQKEFSNSAKPARGGAPNEGKVQ